MLYDGEPLWEGDEDARERFKDRFGVLYQNAALWSSMTLEENVSLPLVERTGLGAAEARDVARLKLALVGLAGFEDHYPAEISGGMRKRAGLARAMALDPEILYFDEPSAGLDPLSSRRLDDLILELRDELGHHDRARDPRAAQHLRAGRQCRVSRRGAQDHDRPGATRGAEAQRRARRCGPSWNGGGCEPEDASAGGRRLRAGGDRARAGGDRAAELGQLVRAQEPASRCSSPARCAASTRARP